jgi:hypothetical protein
MPVHAAYRKKITDREAAMIRKIGYHPPPTRTPDRPRDRDAEFMLERQQRIQTTLVTAQGVRSANPRYPACAHPKHHIMETEWNGMNADYLTYLRDTPADELKVYEGKPPEGGYQSHLEPGRYGQLCTNHKFGVKHPHLAVNHCPRKACYGTAFCRGHGANITNGNLVSD